MNENSVLSTFLRLLILNDGKGFSLMTLFFIFFKIINYDLGGKESLLIPPCLSVFLFVFETGLPVAPAVLEWVM